MGNNINFQNKKIVTLNGSFDLFHDGHRDAIEQGLEISKNLILLINSDKSVQRYKGEGRPIQNLKKE